LYCLPRGAVGTKVYKQFPGHGFVWGEVTVSMNDTGGFYFKVEYANGEIEKITIIPYG
jgi:hypothetical protein